MAFVLGKLDYRTWLAGSFESAEVAAPLIIEATAPASVVDVGCGLGAWLAVFKELGVEDVRGYDGPWVDRSQLLVAPPEFAVADLRQRLVPDRRFDLAICLEVAHMLEPEHAAPLVEALAELADVVVFSAGIPGQRGSQHLNLQWPAYWAGLFARCDYVALDPFRAALWEQPNVKWWFSQNMVAFARPAALERLPALARARCEQAPLPLVHPECLRDVLEAASEVPAPQTSRWPWRRSRS